MRLGALAFPLVPPLCWSCGAAAGNGAHLCRSCRARMRYLGADQPGAGGLAVWAAVAYDGPARELVKALKYRGARAVAATMAAQIAALGPPLGGELVPVPPHPARLRRRGFDQARALAEQLATRRGLGLADCLERIGGHAPQVGRQRAERLAGPSMRVKRGAGVPARVVLVDDVVTTGATLAACAAPLRAEGATEIAAVAYARTLGR